jgi:hypothetical protein
MSVEESKRRLIAALALLESLRPFQDTNEPIFADAWKLAMREAVEAAHAYVSEV